jgi:hypothetical protein
MEHSGRRKRKQSKTAYCGYQQSLGKGCTILYQTEVYHSKKTHDLVSAEV